MIETSSARSAVMRFIPDPGAVVLLIAVGLIIWVVFRMVTWPELDSRDFEGEFDESERRSPEDDARRSQI